MDTSETYIKMCNCPLIQGEWKLPPFAHDFCYRVRDGLIKPGQNLSAMEFDAEEWLWLPRQDQIQEMIFNATGDFDTSIAHITLVRNFAYFCGAGGEEDAEGCSNVSIRKGTLEVLWLAFYMYYCHKLIWDGEKWEKK